MFGLPYYQSKIDSQSYDKNNIIDDILYNYNLDKNRNVWRPNSNLHHVFNDENNTKFKKINYGSLENIYKFHVRNFLISSLKKDLDFELKIVNYTCMLSDQYMELHHHNGDFAGIHYLKFNKNEHKSTLYKNPYAWGTFLNELTANSFVSSIEMSNEKFSYLFDEWSLNVEEDDFVLTPALLPHLVPLCKSNDHRISIISYIKIKK